MSAGPVGAAFGYLNVTRPPASGLKRAVKQIGGMVVTRIRMRYRK